MGRQEGAFRERKDVRGNSGFCCDEKFVNFHFPQATKSNLTRLIEGFEVKTSRVDAKMT